MRTGHNSGIVADELPRIHIARVHINDWRSSYFGATVEEEGFAWRLTLLIYDNMGELPDDDESNARAMAMDIRVYRRLKQRLVKLGKFNITSGCISQHRIVREIEHYVSEHRRRSQAAREREAGKKLQRGSDELPANFAGTSTPMFAGSPAEVPAKSGELPAELTDDLFEKRNENNVCIATAVTTSGPEPSQARALPKPKPKPLSEEKRVKPNGADAPSSADADPSPPDAPKGPTKADALAAFNAYNELAQRVGLPQAAKFTPGREKAIRARLREYGSDGWLKALSMIERSKFLRGTNDRNWRADLDFVVQASSFTKLIEGRYGNGAHASPSDPNRDASRERYLAELEEARRQDELIGGFG